MKIPARAFIPVLLSAALAPPLGGQSYRPDLVEPRLTGFGTAVAVGDGEVLVAWPHFTGFTPMMPPNLPGDVLVFRRNGAGAWHEVSRFSAAAGTNDNRFGRALAVRRNRLVAGATKQDDDLGAAYVFERGGEGAWRQAARLRPKDETDLQNFGRVVALGDEFALVSSVAYNDGSGTVFVFHRDAASGAWSEHSRLDGSGLQPRSYFGLSIAIEGNLAAIGAPLADERAGTVFLFRYDAEADAWREVAKLEGRGVDSNGQFGTAAVIAGGHVLVGAPGVQGFTGTVVVFGADRETGEWSEVGRLTAFDGAQGSQFGRTLAVSDDEVWVGAPNASNAEGRVYVFRMDSDTHEWRTVTKLSLDGLKARDLFGFSLAVSGGVAAVTVANDDFGEGSVAIFERDREGSWTSVTKLATEVEGLDPIVGGQVDCVQGAASLFGCDRMDLVSFLPVHALGGSRGVEVNDVWGWEDPETGREYALVGRYDGTAFVDVSNPVNPVYVGELKLHAGAIGNAWRDIKVYKNHAFIVADGAGEHGMQIFDLTQLRGVHGAPVTFEETAHYAGIQSAHNIVINEETGYAYSVGSNGGGETCGGGLHMINLENPTAPTFAGCFSDPNTGQRRTGYSHDAQCVIYHGPDTAYQGKEICFGSNETALSVADVTDKQSPVAVSSATYPNVGYAHQGWITEDHRYFLMNDEGDELNGTVEATRTLIWDVTDLDDPILLKEFFGTNAASDHNLYVKGNLVFQSNYVSGLRVIDISDIENPREVAYFDTVSGENRPGFAGSWSNYPFFQSGVVVVTSGREGLFVLKQREGLVP